MITNPTFNEDGVKVRKTDYNDRRILDRHTKYGKGLYFFDGDMHHYIRGGKDAKITDWIEYKSRHTVEIELDHPGIISPINAADQLNIPFFMIFTDEEDFTFRIYQFSFRDDIKRWISPEKNGCRISEKDLVWLFWHVRGIDEKNQEHYEKALKNANTKLAEWKMTTTFTRDYYNLLGKNASTTTSSN